MSTTLPIHNEHLDRVFAALKAARTYEAQTARRLADVEDVRSNARIMAERAEAQANGLHRAFTALLEGCAVIEQEGEALVVVIKPEDTARAPEKISVPT